MTRSNRYPLEVRERAIALVFEHKGEYRSEWAAMESIAAKFLFNSKMNLRTPHRHGTPKKNSLHRTAHPWWS